MSAAAAKQILCSNCGLLLRENLNLGQINCMNCGITYCPDCEQEWYRGAIQEDIESHQCSWRWVDLKRYRSFLAGLSGVALFVIGVLGLIALGFDSYKDLFWEVLGRIVSTIAFLWIITWALSHLQQSARKKAQSVRTSSDLSATDAVPPRPISYDRSSSVVTRMGLVVLALAILAAVLIAFIEW